MSKDKNLLNEQESKNLIREFVHLFEPLTRTKQQYTQHPSKDQIEDYLSNSQALSDEWQRPQNDETLWMGSADEELEWTLTEISLHVQTCHQCGKLAEKIRKAERGTSWFQEHFSAFGFAGYRKRIWAWTYTATAAAALLALMINVLPNSFNSMDNTLISNQTSVVNPTSFKNPIVDDMDNKGLKGNYPDTDFFIEEVKPVQFNTFDNPSIQQF